MKTFTLLSFLLLLLFTRNTVAQITYDFGFERNDSLSVYDSLGIAMDFPWVGGLNAVHFQDIDMNLDGYKDLLVFEKHGDKKYTFINMGISHQTAYRYEPRYEKRFPKLWSWAILADYNCDGKNDLFTYVPGGIALYKNISSPGNGLQFQQVSPMINYITTNGTSLNIYLSSEDYPAISDIDGDGDLDILTFHILGTFLVYYKNLSMEKYGDCEHLEYKIADKCWGKFAESETRNSVFLNTQCNYKSDLTPEEVDFKSAKHTGSTCLIIDLNADSVKDLILGDVDFFTVIGLINGGTRDSAFMVSQDSLFPSYDSSLNLVSFPVVNYVDIDNDSINELIASPFDASYFKPKGSNSIWLYENSGSNNNPQFHFQKRNFFQEEMIDIGNGSLPAITDVDGDGLMDIVIANYGLVDSTYFDTLWGILTTEMVSSLTWFRNTGTATAPQFKKMDGNWLNLPPLKLSSARPTFGDLDGDGDEDMLLGNADGKLLYFENTAGSGNMMTFAQPISAYQNIDVGEYSAPDLFDISGDSLPDLVIGKKNGWLSYYENTGTAANPVFTWVTDSMGHALSTNYWNFYNGYSVPYAYKDQHDSLVMMVGSAAGYVFYYRHIRQNIQGQFGIDSNLIYTDFVDTLYSVAYFINEGKVMEFIQGGMRTAPALYDFNSDGYPDMILGNFSGGLNYFSGRQPAGVGFGELKPDKPQALVYPNPGAEKIKVCIKNNGQYTKAEFSLYALDGRFIGKMPIKPSTDSEILLPRLPNGLYFYRIDAYRRNGSSERIPGKLLIINR